MDEEATKKGKEREHINKVESENKKQGIVREKRNVVNTKKGTSIQYLSAEIKESTNFK